MTHSRDRAVPETVQTPAQLDLPRAGIPRVLQLVDRDDNAQGVWRTAWPSLQASAHGYIADWCTFENIETIQGWINARRYNVIVTPRMTFLTDEAHVRWNEGRVADNFRWIYESDDDLFTEACVEREVKVFGSDRQIMEAQRQARLRMLAECDGVTVSRPSLAEIVRRYTDAPVLVVPNFVDVAWWRAQIAGRERVIPPLTIGWAGAFRDLGDLVPVADAWRNLARRFPDVRFVVEGNQHAHPLIDAIPRERLDFLPWTSFAEYPASLLSIDIACCAMSDEPWNRSKSANKLWENSLSGAACVCSPTVYGEVVEEGKSALIADSAAEWEAQLALLVEQPELRERLNQRSLELIEQNHSIQQQWWQWPQAWAKVLQAQPQSNGAIKNGRQFNAERYTGATISP